MSIIERFSAHTQQIYQKYWICLSIWYSLCNLHSHSICIPTFHANAWIMETCAHMKRNGHETNNVLTTVDKLWTPNRTLVANAIFHSSGTSIEKEQKIQTRKLISDKYLREIDIQTAAPTKKTALLLCLCTQSDSILVLWPVCIH